MMLLNFIEFRDYIQKYILEYMPEKYEGAKVNIAPMLKPNSVFLYGLTIRQKGSNIAPTLYLNDYYEQYCSNENIESVINNIAEEYQKCIVKESDFDIRKITDFESMKDLITTKVLNARKNRILASENPSVRIDDLAIFYQVYLEDFERGSAMIPVTNEMLKCWNISTQELHNLAVENTERLFPPVLVDIESILFGTEENLFEMADEKPEGRLLVLKNERNLYGASAIANPDVLQKISEVVQDDYFILPSSIHEVLIFPKESAKEMGMTPKELGAMVRSVNGNEVCKEEQLSDHIYSYYRDKKVLETVKDSKDKSKDMER